MMKHINLARFRHLSGIYLRIILWLMILITAAVLFILNTDPEGRLAATLDHYTSPNAAPITLR